MDRSRPARSSRTKPTKDDCEDWTKISDRTERRRIQNRISQRKYREKMRQRHRSESQESSSSSSSQSISALDQRLLQAPLPLSGSVSPASSAIGVSPSERDILAPRRSVDAYDGEPEIFTQPLYDCYETAFPPVPATPSFLFPWPEHIDPDLAGTRAGSSAGMHSTPAGTPTTNTLYFEPQHWQQPPSPYMSGYYDAQDLTWLSQPLFADLGDKRSDPGEFKLPMSSSPYPPEGVSLAWKV